LTNEEPLPVAPEPDRRRVQRWARIVTRSLAVIAVVLVLGSIALYFAARGPTGALNGFLSDLKARRDAQAWTQLCAADQREISQAGFATAWRKQRTTYGAVIDEIDAYTFEPFGNVRHSHYRLSFRDGKVIAITYPVDVVREAGHWKVCNFFARSRNPANPSLLSGFQN
jgi:hypothetical protein